jgi:hypothetical protein
MQWFVMCYIIVGLVILGATLFAIGTDYCFQLQSWVLLHMDDDPNDGKTPHGWKFFLSFFLIFSTMGIGSLFMVVNEGWSAVDAIYWSFVTSTTIGYGDLVLKQESSLLFSFFYILASTTVVAFGLNNMREIHSEIQQERRRQV